jgi:hypothetical protein
MNNKFINKYVIGNAEDTEVILFGRSEDEQNFYIRNEYGNFNIQFDLMTGFEMISRMKDDMESYINQELQKDFSFQNKKDESSYPDVSTFKTNESNDCQGLGVV